jgi:hypothetical protein
MKAELYRPAPAEGEPETVVAVATWRGGTTSVEVVDASVPGLEAVVRPTPVAVDDPALRSQGTHGPVLLWPGDLQWFIAAVRARAEALGLSVRFVVQGGRGGWDPASQYRTFEQQVETLERERS